MANHPTTIEQIKSIFQLPVMAAIVVPGLIHYFSRGKSLIPINSIDETLSKVIGSIFLIIGLLLFAQSVKLFIQIGNGTLAPWNPTKNIVIKSLYRYVRNPMLIGVNLFICGEAFFLQSGNIMIWLIFFICLNTIYFIYSEEPALSKRFGKEYEDYCKHVSRWLPRLKAYYPEGES